MTVEEMSISEQVITTVANATNRDPLELPALFHTIDPDALDTLIETMRMGEFIFEFAGASVTIHRSGAVSAVSV